MIEAIIVDDEELGRLTLRELLHEFCPDVNVLAACESVPSGIRAIERRQPQLVFLDVRMPRGSGFDLLQSLSKRDFEVIFTTAYDNYAIPAFRANALDYLLKPIDPAELQSSVRKFGQRSGRRAAFNGAGPVAADRPYAHGIAQIALPTMEGYSVLRLEDILRCEAQGRYTIPHLTTGESPLFSVNIGEVEARLAGKGFYRVHHSHLINMRHVCRYVREGSACVIMSDGSRVNVARRKREEFINILAS